jgi:hypothetical protein
LAATDLSDAHATTEVIKNVCHRDSRATNAGFAAANSRINADVLEVVHGNMVAQNGCAGAQAQWGKFRFEETDRLWTWQNRFFKVHGVSSNAG